MSSSGSWGGHQRYGRGPGRGSSNGGAISTWGSIIGVGGAGCGGRDSTSQD
jgi:hypothetical protein